MPFKAELSIVVMPAYPENIEATAACYSRIFGMEFSRTWTDLVKVYYAPISLDATMFSVEYRSKEDWEDRLLTVPVITIVAEGLEEYCGPTASGTGRRA